MSMPNRLYKDYQAKTIVAIPLTSAYLLGACHAVPVHRLGLVHATGDKINILIPDDAQAQRGCTVFLRTSV